MSKEAKQTTLFGSDHVECRSTLVKVAKLSMTLARKHMASYSSYKSRHDFTQPQLMTCLILKAYLKATYRDIVDHLASSFELRDAMGLTKLPNYSTLCKFAGKDSVLEVLDGMLATLAKAIDDADDSTCKEAAMDATGLETSCASAHYKARSGRKRRGFLKVSVVVMSDTLIPAAMVFNFGPGNDKTPARQLLPKAKATIQPDLLYAYAGYDAEWVHEFCNEEWQTFSVINPVKHKEGTLNGVYRSQMTKKNLKKLGYGRRWLVESYMAGLKRTTGSTLNAHTRRGMKVEAGMKVLAYALRR